jgi:Holliday junction resolvasome RuvABC endonuclease subunit
MSKFLCLDLGTTTGFAVGDKGLMLSGVWSFRPGRFEGGGMRFVKFRTKLAEIKESFPASHPITHVFFEEVRRHRGVDAAHVYGGLMAVLTAWCEENNIPYSGVPVGTIKMHFTGKGNASKEMMIAECERRNLNPFDDNEADAIAIFDWATTEYSSEVGQKTCSPKA